jgi:hypothetical protein
MKNLLRMSLTFAFLMSFQVACVTRGDQFNSDYSWIEKGKTSQLDVMKRLGQPFSVGHSSGRPTWTYGFYSYRLIGDSNTKELTFYWDDERKVDSFSFKSSFPDDRQKILMAPK